MRLAALRSAIEFIETFGIANEFDLAVIRGYARWYLRS